MFLTFFCAPFKMDIFLISIFGPRICLKPSQARPEGLGSILNGSGDFDTP